MAGSLVLLSEVNVTSGATANITFSDTSFDVYVLQFNNVVADTDDKDLYFRFTASGTADSSANYDYASYELRDDTTFTKRGASNGTYLPVNISGQGTGTGEACNGTIHAFNFNDASEYSFCTMEITMFDFSTRLFGWQAGGALTVTQATDGFEFFWESSVDFTSGTFTLYGLKK
tara:strand:+ start:133 stop:654 length:522 start_codon:yes stop_codon:yes gene_type:complete